MTPKNTIIQAAQSLKNQGIPFIPCFLNDKGKKPPISEFSRFAQKPESINIAKALEAIEKGKASIFAIWPYVVKNLYCLDVDTKNSALIQESKIDSLIELALKEGLFIEKSVSGGYHIFFYSTNDLQAIFKNTPIIQLFGGSKKSGYVVIAPSKGYEAISTAQTFLETKEPKDAFLSRFFELFPENKASVKEIAESTLDGLKTALNHVSGIKHAKSFINKAENALNEACQYLFTCENGTDRKNQIPHLVGNVGFFADALGGIDNAINRMIEARKANKEQESAAFHFLIIRSASYNGFSNWFNSPKVQKLLSETRGGDPPTDATATPNGNDTGKLTATEGVTTESVTATATDNECSLVFRQQKHNGNGIEIEKYLSDEPEIFEKVWKALQTGDALLDAAAGSGKSRFCLSKLANEIKKQGAAFIFACPFKTQVSQIKESIAKDKKNVFDKSISVLESGERYDSEANDWSVVCVYDKVKTIAPAMIDAAKRGAFDARKIYFIIDETHLLTESYAKLFRRKAIRAINEQIEAAKKETDIEVSVLHITATPDYLRYNKGFTHIKAISKEAPKLDLTVQFYMPIKNISTRQSFFYTAIKQGMIGAEKGKPLVVRLNDKGLIRTFAAALVKDRLVNDNEIGFFYSQSDATSENELKQYVEENSKLPESLKILFVTSIFDQAINIEESEIHKLLILPVNAQCDFYAATLVQLYNRFRSMKTVKTILLWPEKRLENSAKWTHRNYHFNSCLIRAGISANELNKLSSQESDKIEGITDFSGTAKNAELTKEDESGIKQTDIDAALFESFKHQSQTQGIINYLEAAALWIPAGKMQVEFEQAYSDNATSLEEAKAETKEVKQGAKIEIFEAMDGKAAMVLGYMLKTSKNLRTKQCLKNLNIEPSELPDKIREIIEASKLEIDKELIDRELSKFADIHIFFAKHGFTPEYTRRLVLAKGTDIEETQSIFRKALGFYAYDYSKNVAPKLAAIIASMNKEATQVHILRNSVANYLNANIDKIKSLESEKIERLKARIEAENGKGAKARKARQTMAQAIERLEAATSKTYHIKVDELCLPSELSKAQALHLLIDFWGGIETKQSESRNGKEAEIAANDFFAKDMNTAFLSLLENMTGIEAAKDVIEKINTHIKDYAYRKELIDKKEATESITYQSHKIKVQMTGDMPYFLDADIDYNKYSIDKDLPLPF